MHAEIASAVGAMFDSGLPALNAAHAALGLASLKHGRDQNDNAVRVTERGAGLSLMPDATTDDIRAACVRLLGEPQFRAGAKRLGDVVAAEAQGSTRVRELEATAAQRRPRTAPA